MAASTAAVTTEAPAAVRLPTPRLPPETDDDPCNIRGAWPQPLPLLGGRISLTGASRAGRYTGWFVKEAGVMFDGGLRSMFNPLAVCITHGHADHCSALPCLLTGLSTAPRVLVPEGTQGYHVAALEAAARLTTDGHAGVAEYFGSGITVHGVTAGRGPPADLELVGGLSGEGGWWPVPTPKKHGRAFSITVFECHHRVRCVGYGLWETVTKIKPEFVGTPGADIAAAKAAGVAVSNSVRVPLLAVCGDTTARVFELNPTLAATFPIIVVECTFFGSDDVMRAHAVDKTHMHWDDLKPIVAAHPSTLFILAHFSERFSHAEIEAHFAEHGLPNAQPWLPTRALAVATITP